MLLISPSRRLRARLGLGALVACLLSLWASSVPGGEGSVSVVSVLPLLALMVWAVVALLWLVALARSRGEGSGLAWRGWLIVPALALTTVAVVSADLPVRTRFAISLPAIERFASSTPSAEATTSAGLYQVCCFERTDFGYRFSVSDTGFTSWGFAYSPDGPPPGPEIAPYFFVDGLSEGADAYRHLQGPWYVWEYRYS